jgi:hypothetical protein
LAALSENLFAEFSPHIVHHPVVTMTFASVFDTRDRFNLAEANPASDLIPENQSILHRRYSCVNLTSHLLIGSICGMSSSPSIHALFPPSRLSHTNLSTDSRPVVSLRRSHALHKILAHRQSDRRVQPMTIAMLV